METFLMLLRFIVNDEKDRDDVCIFTFMQFHLCSYGENRGCNMKNIEVWWKQAERDMKSSNNSLNSKDYYVSALLSQQAIEKALKCLYLKEKGELLRIHDVVKLAREVNAPLEIVKKCAVINPVYVEVRYPEGNELPADKINKNEAERLLELAKEVLLWIEKRL